MIERSRNTNSSRTMRALFDRIFPANVVSRKWQLLIHCILWAIGISTAVVGFMFASRTELKLLQTMFGCNASDRMAVFKQALGAIAQSEGTASC